MLIPRISRSLAIGALCLPGIAAAAGTTVKPSAPIQAVLQGTVNYAQIAVGASAIANARPTHPVATLVHRYPDGAALRLPSKIPPYLRPNVTVTDRLAPLTTPPTSITGFSGLSDGIGAGLAGDGELEPPDQGLAVYNNTVAEIINNAFQITSSLGKVKGAPVSTDTFFAVNGANNLSDPHVVFDPTIKRWFVEELLYGSTFTGFAVAVSQTADPTGTYNLYYIDAASSGIAACGASLCLPDYPQVGFDANGFYIAADLFSNSSGGFVTTALYALPKAALAAGASFSYVYFKLPDFVVQPAIPAPGQAFETAANGTEYAMTARNIYDGSTNIRVWAVSNTNNLAATPTTLIAHSVTVAAQSYTGSTPSTEPNKVGPYGQSQGATTSPQLDGGYNAFGGGVKYAANKLYAALTTASTDGGGLARDVIAYFVVTPTATATAVTATITAQGYVVPADGYSVSFPSLALDSSGNGIIGMSITNKSAGLPGSFPSTAFIELQADALAGALTVTGKGATADDGFTGYGGAGPAGVGRWGDYAGGTVDAKTGHFWVANEFIPKVTKTKPRGTYANWGTYITQVH